MSLIKSVFVGEKNLDADYNFESYRNF